MYGFPCVKLLMTAAASAILALKLEVYTAVRALLTLELAVGIAVSALVRNDAAVTASLQCVAWRCGCADSASAPLCLQREAQLLQQLQTMLLLFTTTQHASMWLLVCEPVQNSVNNSLYNM